MKSNTNAVPRVVTLAAAVLAIAGCSLPSQSTAVAVRFHGEATDPVGDTASSADARVPLPADLVYASVQVSDDAVHLIVRFAPGSFDAAMTGAVFEVDTDLDPNTGVSNHNPDAQYLVSLETAPVREAAVGRGLSRCVDSESGVRRVRRTTQLSSRQLRGPRRRPSHRDERSHAEPAGAVHRGSIGRTGGRVITLD